jgi:hypothetical protein
MIPFVICFNCKNYLKKATCKAFPNGIPEEILLGRNDHSKPLPDQKNTIVFEKIEPNHKDQGTPTH